MRHIIMASGVKKKYMDGTDTGWKSITGTNITGTLYYRKLGNIWQIKNMAWFKLVDDLAPGNNRLLVTIPAEDRPGVMFGNAYWNTSPYPILAVKIENGQVRLYNSSSVTITGGTNLMLNVISLV